MEKFTKQELESNNETQKHINIVRGIIRFCEENLRDRAESHDASKMMNPEVEIFAKMTPKLKASTYGSDEYNEFLDEMKPALNSHYAKNSHHPEHHKDGINDMNIIDIVEMICDWKAASMRHDDGNILKSIEINTKRFGIDTQLSKILINTVKLFEERNTLK